jgi:hypothetical protein
MAGLLLIKIQNLRQPHCQAKKMMTPIPQPRNALIEHKWFCNYLFLSSICLLTCYSVLISEVPLLAGGEAVVLDSPSDWKNVLKNGRRLLLEFSSFLRFLIFFLNP